jgi:hypothetical protein
MRTISAFTNTGNPAMLALARGQTACFYSEILDEALWLDHTRRGRGHSAAPGIEAPGAGHMSNHEPPKFITETLIESVNNVA